MRQISFILALLFGGVGTSCAQVSRATDAFIQKVSYAATLVRAEVPISPRLDDLGRTLLSLAKVDDATLAESFKLLDKNKSYQRTTVGDLLLVLIFDIPTSNLKQADLANIHDVLSSALSNFGPLPSNFPWINDSNGFWNLSAFATKPEQVDSLTDRLHYFQSKWPRRSFKDEPMYGVSKAKPL